MTHPAGAAGIRSLLAARRCIQLDPLDRIGTNADLVALARVDGVAKGDVYRHLLGEHAFEHFAKERCILPAGAFPYYRDQSALTPWWRLTERLKRIPAEVLEAVHADVAARGPLPGSQVAEQGSVAPLDWHGWKGTGRLTTMALQVLWVQCRVVVAGRVDGVGKGKIYDLPERALGSVAAAPVERPFAEWALRERVEAAGLLSRKAGPWWSVIHEARRSELPDRLVAEGAVEEVTIAGGKGRWLAPVGWRDRAWPDDDGRMRILGPLDPLLWDRELVQRVFGFEYVWEVYKPAAKRRWGYYVCPLLHDGWLVGRFEGRVRDGALVVEQLWREPGRAFDEAAFQAALERHAHALGVGLQSSAAWTTTSPGVRR